MAEIEAVMRAAHAGLHAAEAAHEAFKRRAVCTAAIAAEDEALELTRQQAQALATLKSKADKESELRLRYVELCAQQATIYLGLNDDVDELFQKKLAAKRKSDTSKAPDGADRQRRRQEGYGYWGGASWGEAQKAQGQKDNNRRWAASDAGNRERDRRRR